MNWKRGVSRAEELNLVYLGVVFHMVLGPSRALDMHLGVANIDKTTFGVLCVGLWVLNAIANSSFYHLFEELSSDFVICYIRAGVLNELAVERFEHLVLPRSDLVVGACLH